MTVNVNINVNQNNIIKVKVYFMKTSVIKSDYSFVLRNNLCEQNTR